MPNRDYIQTNLELHPRHRELLERTAKENAWPLRETVIRGVRLLDVLTTAYRERAEEIEADGYPGHAEVLRRILRDLGLEVLVNHEIKLGVNDLDDAPALHVGEVLFIVSPDDLLLAVRDLDTGREVSIAHNGQLTLVGVYPHSARQSVN
jgi:hypothetical protein